MFDDVPGILQNPSIQGMWPPSRWFDAPPGSTPSGRPVLNLTLALNYAYGRFDVRGYHMVNVGVHLAAALALFGVVRRTLLTPRLRDRYGSIATPAAFAVALLWVVHPLNTESVTYVIQRGEALAGLFLLLTLYLAILGARSGNRPSRVPRQRTTSDLAPPEGRNLDLAPVGAVAACALGMGSKETMIVAPVVVMLWDHVFLVGGARRWRLYLALFATTIVVLFPMLSETQGRTAVARALSGGGRWTPWTYLLTQTGVVTHYLQQVVLARPLVFDYYGWPPATSIADVWPSALFLAALIGVTVWGLVKRSPAAFALAAFLVTLAPTSSVLPIPTEIAAEHRMYLPLTAILALAIVAVYSRVRAQKQTRISVALLFVFVCYQAAAATRERNPDYHSDMTLWHDTVEKRPGNARARLNYAIDLMADSRPAEAETQMREALSLDMDDGTRAQALLQLGAALAAQGQTDAGITSIEQGLKINPSLTDADAILGQAYADQGKDALAAKYLLRAAEKKDQKQRELILQRAAWVLATSRDPAVRDGTRAVTLIQEAIGMTGGREALHFETLAAACAEQGRVADAIAAMDRAISLTRARGDEKTTSLYERQRAFYAAGGRVAR